MSYGANLPDLFRHGAYVDKILKGTKPRLPVQQPAKFELAVNLKAAKAIGLSIPLVSRPRRRGHRVRRREFIAALGGAAALAR